MAHPDSLILLTALRSLSEIVCSQLRRLTACQQRHSYSRSLLFRCCRRKLVRNECSRFGFIELIPCWEKTSSPMEFYLHSEICKQMESAFFNVYKHTCGLTWILPSMKISTLKLYASARQCWGWVCAHESFTLHLMKPQRCTLAMAWEVCPALCTCATTGTDSCVKYASVAIKLSSVLWLQMCCDYVWPCEPASSQR